MSGGNLCRSGLDLLLNFGNIGIVSGLRFLKLFLQFRLPGSQFVKLCFQLPVFCGKFAVKFFLLCPQPGDFRVAPLYLGSIFAVEFLNAGVDLLLFLIA